MESMGIEIGKEEDMPTDAYSEKERWKMTPPPTQHATKTDTLRRFLEYDGKVLAFDVVWDNREGDVCAELIPYKLLYFLQDDTIAIKELHDGRGGKDPFPLLLKKTKIPKKWKEKPVDFPSGVMETTEAEVTEYYSPVDLLVGETVFIFGRRMLLCDCDPFTRHYFKVMLNIDQPPRVHIDEKKPPEFKRVLPPHIGIGAPEDSIGSCYGLLPKPPHKDVIRYNLNANKYLRYLCELEWIHPEDKGRQFVLSYSLADGSIKIGEIPRRNSGIKGGKFLKSMRLETPDSDPNFPTYITPEKFFIGATVPVFKHRFKIIGCDLFVYRYMSANPEKFPPEVIDNVRNYHMREGNLKDDLQEAVREEQAAMTRAELAKIGQSAEAQPSDMQRCLAALNVTEGEAEPPPPPPAPTTTDRISYDDSLRMARLSKPPCEGVVPLKGILKSGAARDDHQKVVCFSGPAPPGAGGEEHAAKKHVTYPPGEQPHYNDDEDFCDRYKDPGVEERAERRAKDICPYEIVPSARSQEEPAEPPPPGHLGTYGVDCNTVPDHMRITAHDYEGVKSMRRDVPEISPEATRVSRLPTLPTPPAADCLAPAAPPAAGTCRTPQPEDVAFACPHPEPRMPCCVPNDCGDRPNAVTKL